MDDRRFDDLARGLDELVRSRRGLGRLLAGGALAVLLGRVAADDAAAKPGDGRGPRQAAGRGDRPGRRDGGAGNRKRDEEGKGGGRDPGRGTGDGRGDESGDDGRGNGGDGRGDGRGGAGGGPRPAGKGNGKGKGGNGGKKCKNGKKKCGKQCVNPKTNAAHCGGCGRVCGAGQSCVNGVCQGGSPPGGGGCAADLFACNGACVDPKSDEAHCGACGNACSGDLTCEGSTCACAEGTRCGTDCVDPQTADDHCGACNSRCGAGRTCQGGQCVAAPCGQNQLDCGGGLCVDNSDGLACCRFGECGELTGSGDLQCNTDTHKCVCRSGGRERRGVCHRNSSGSGICNECCGDGSRNCVEDTVCRQETSPQGYPYAFCDCPPDKTRCLGSDAHKCQRNLGADDDRRCGRVDCIDCTRDGRYCCGGRCLSPGEPGRQVDLDQPCKEGCQRCPSGQVCCRTSAGSALFGCTAPDPPGSNWCPGPPP